MRIIKTSIYKVKWLNRSLIPNRTLYINHRFQDSIEHCYFKPHRIKTRSLIRYWITHLYHLEMLTNQEEFLKVVIIFNYRPLILTVTTMAIIALILMMYSKNLKISNQMKCQLCIKPNIRETLVIMGNFWKQIL